MRILVTGATGPVGSNIVKVLTDLHGDEVIDDRVDLLDADAIRTQVAASAPDGIIHGASGPGWARILADRQYGWRAHVESTRAYAEAADRAGIPFVLVSTDWVFDGTQGPADEHTPPNPVNLQGFLKAAAEIVALDRGGAVARLSGVSGTHWARPDEPRRQSHSFTDFAGAVVDALEAGQPFTVWESGDINMVATPGLASLSGQVVRAMVADRMTGIAHCCSATPLTRRELADLTVEVFDLDRDLLRFGPPDEPAPMPIPFDTSLDGAETAKRLDFTLPGMGELLEALDRERSAGELTRFLD